MPFGRWMRIVGWRHIVAIIMVIWALFPALYVINLAFSGGNTLTAACPPDRPGLAALTCLVPNNLSLDNFTAVLTSTQWPFAIWFRNTVILATLNSFLALLMGACRRVRIQPAAVQGPPDGPADADAGADVPGRAGADRDLHPAAVDRRRVPAASACAASGACCWCTWVAPSG